MSTYLICGHYNLNNGDRAVLEATLDLIRKYDADAEITVSAYAPEEFYDPRVARVVPWPVRDVKGLKKLGLHLCAAGRYGCLAFKTLICKGFVNAVREADVVLVSGGHHLTDILGDLTMYDLAASFIVPISMGKKPFLLPQTFGPIKRPSAMKERLVCDIVSGSSEVCARDEGSLAFLGSLCESNGAVLMPDLVYSLGVSKDAVVRSAKTIGIALYCNYATVEGKTIMAGVIGSLARASAEFMRRGYDVEVIPMEVKGSVADDRVRARELVNTASGLCPNGPGRMFIKEPEDGSDITRTVEEFEGLDLVFACKTHSTVFSIVGNSPVVAIAYHEKTIEFMGQVGLVDYAIWDSEVSAEMLLAMADRALARSEEVKCLEAAFVAEANTKIGELFEAICSGR